MFIGTLENSFDRPCQQYFTKKIAQSSKMRKKCSFFNNWFFLELSTGGVQCNFDNPAWKFLPNSEVFSAQIRKWWRIDRFFVYIQKVSFKMFRWTLRTQRWKPAKNLQPKYRTVSGRSNVRKISRKSFLWTTRRKQFWQHGPNFFAKTL